MKAILVNSFCEPEVMKMQEVKVPTPGKDEVLIDVQAAGVNPVDTYIRSGLYPIKPD